VEARQDRSLHAKILAMKLIGSIESSKGRNQ
jgi:hypothetical protein